MRKSNLRTLIVKYLEEPDWLQLTRKLGLRRNEFRAMLEAGELPPRLLEILREDWALMRDMLAQSKNGQDLMSQILTEAFESEQGMNPAGIALVRTMRTFVLQTTGNDGI